MKRLIFYILIIINFSLLLKLIQKFNNQSTEIDRLQILISQIKKNTKKHSKIKLITNETQISKILFQTQFIMAPDVIITQDINFVDSIIIIDNKNNQSNNKILSNYKVIKKTNNKEYSITFAIKK